MSHQPPPEFPSLPKKKPRAHMQSFTFPTPGALVSLDYISKIHWGPARLWLCYLSRTTTMMQPSYCPASFHSYLSTISSPHSSWSLENQVTFWVHSNELHCLCCGWQSSTCLASLNMAPYFEMLCPSLYLCFHFKHSESVARSWPLHLLWPSMLSFFHWLFHNTPASSHERFSSDCPL